MARLLVGSFPHARPPDAETYLASLAAVLSGYPASIAAECCDPRRGLARQLKFPPTVAEIIAWCDAKAVSLGKPEPVPRLPAPKIDRSSRPSLDELRAKYGPRWGLKGLQ